MHVREVRMAVREGLMPMRVGVRLDAIPGEVMCVAVVFVMHMPVGMCQGLMRVRVFVPLGQVQPDAHPHQRRRQPEHAQSMRGICEEW